MAPEASPRREKRRQQILDAARDLFVEKGYVATTVDDIVTRVEVARGTFYLYFDDKLDVFSALVDRFFVRSSGAIHPIDLSEGAPSPREQLRENLRRFVQLTFADPGMVKIALSTATGIDTGLDQRLARFYSALRTFMDETLQTGQSIGLVREGDRQLMAAIALGGLKELLLEVTRELARSEDELVDAILAFLESGLLH
ncbi:MAG: TetR/AcrR family transcriptional regulator [Myxococcota bacterium]